MARVFTIRWVKVSAPGVHHLLSRQFPELRAIISLLVPPCVFMAKAAHAEHQRGAPPLSIAREHVTRDASPEDECRRASVSAKRRKVERRLPRVASRLASDVDIVEGRKRDLLVIPDLKTVTKNREAAPDAATAPLPADGRALDNKGAPLVDWMRGAIHIPGIGIDATTGLSGRVKKSTADRKCDNPGYCPDGVLGDARRGPSLAAVSAAAYTVSALSVGLGAYLVLSTDPHTGAQTSLATDLIHNGAVVRVSRRW